MIVVLLLLQMVLSPEAETREGAESLRVQSQTLVAEGDSIAAIAALDASLSGEWKSPQALLSLGRLHIARGESGLAILALERASRLAPSDIQVATARTEAYAVARKSPPDVAAAFVATRAVTSRIGTGLLVALTLTLYLATLTLLYLWRRGTEDEPRQRLAGWAALGIAPLAVAVLVLAGLALWDVGQARAVALATVDMKSRPSPEASGAGVLREGDIVRIGAAEGLWRQIEAGEQSGWVPSRAVERL